MNARLKIVRHGVLRTLIVGMIASVILLLTKQWEQLNKVVYGTAVMSLLYWIWKAYKKPTDSGDQEHFLGMSTRTGWILFAFFTLICLAVMLLSNPQ